MRRRIIFYYRFMWSSTGSLDQDEILPNLPAPLKAQMDIISTKSIFVTIPVFQACEPHEILRMVQGLVTLLALPGDVLIKLGTMGRGLFFIMRGAVNITSKQPELSPKHKEELRLKFNKFDEDSSGSIDFKELKAAIVSLGYEVKASELRKMVDDIDSDGSGLIEFEEFVEMLMSRKEVLAAVFPEALADFDEGEEQTEGFFGEETTLSRTPSTKTVRAESSPSPSLSLSPTPSPSSSSTSSSSSSLSTVH